MQVSTNELLNIQNIRTIISTTIWEIVVHTSSSSENINISVLLPLVSSADFLFLLAVSVFPVIISEERDAFV